MIRKSQVAAITFGTAMLVVAAGYVARTELVLGEVVADELTAMARERGADLEVRTIRPYGLHGITLEHVAIRLPRGDVALEGVFESVSITPRLGPLFSGDVVPGTVRIRDGELAVVPYTAVARPEPEPAEVPDAAAAGRETETPRAPPEVRFVLEDVGLRFSSGRLSTRPGRLEEGSFVWRGGRAIERLEGRGVLPDGVSFAAELTRDEEGQHLRVHPDERTEIHRWFRSKSPVYLAVGEIDLCPECTQPVAASDIELGVDAWREDMRVTSPTAAVTRRLGAMELASPEMTIVDATTRDFTARLTLARLEYDLDENRVEGRLRFADEVGGTFDTDWAWDGASFDVRFWANEFDLATIIGLTGLDRFGTLGVTRGTVDCRFDLDRGLASIESAIKTEKLVVEVDRFSSEKVPFRDMALGLDALIDFRGRAVSITDSKVTIGPSRPVAFEGWVVRAGSGWSLWTNVKGEGMSALVLRDALPEEIVGVARGTRVRGEFDFALTASGNTAFPESLMLDGYIDGDVEVRGGPPEADVSGLGWSGAPPTIRNESVRRDWKSYDELPVIVPRVLLAAEDTRFFRHAGFDWAGFRRAMIENIRAGGLARGGSTISQQVVKNVFLRRDRTIARKLQEAFLTWRMEQEIEKERILEIYMNIADWGGGAYGITQAAQRYYETTPDDLTLDEMALLAAILPNPWRFGSHVLEGRLPSSRLEKMEHIFANLKWLEKITPEQYRQYYGAARRGEVGRLRLTICADDDTAPDAAPKCR